MNKHYDQFEEFLQEQLKNHRMYPNDGVWRAIHKKIHGEHTWPALTIAAVIIISAAVIISAHFTSKTSIFAIKPSIEPMAVAKPSAQREDVLKALTSSSPFAKQELKHNDVPQQRAAATNSTAVALAKMASSDADAAPAEDKMNGYSAQEIIVAPDNLSNIEAKAVRDYQFSAFLLNLPVPPPFSSSSQHVAQSMHKPQIGADASSSEANINSADNFFNEHPGDVALHTTPKVQSNKGTFSIQAYIAPSISYRKLNEQTVDFKEQLNNTTARAYAPDVNSLVRHKPGTGIEAGVSILYHLAENLRLKSGLQFNLRQYSIEAYRSGNELARIALNGNDTVNTIAIYRTTNGYSSTELKNRFYQLSAPIGLEWQVLGNTRVAWNIAGSIQPTYLLNKNVYLLSTNLKNYTEVPDIIRNWNVNSNIETFVSLKVGDFIWQLGPQLRYQPVSTFIKAYPIKEHLIDCSIKLGVSTRLR